MKSGLFIFCIHLLILFKQDSFQEYEIKAAFIYNFTQFIEWNDTTAIDTFRIGVAGDSPILNPLSQIAKEKTIKNKPVKVWILKYPEEAKSCQIVFISKEAKMNPERIIEEVKNQSVLVIGEEKGMTKMGAGINLLVVENKLRFEANSEKLKESSLDVSSQLLKLAMTNSE